MVPWEPKMADGITQKSGSGVDQGNEGRKESYAESGQGGEETVLC